MKKKHDLSLTTNNRSRYLLLMLCGLTTVVSAQGMGGGEKWRVTTTMQMQGMSMPGASNEMCKASGNDALPIQPEKNCQVYDAKRTGNTQSFKMRCTGKNAMEGSGEITYLSADHYRGAMKVDVDGQQMTMNYEGRKLGACDAGASAAKDMQMSEEMRQQNAQVHAQIAQANKDMQQGQKDFCTKVTTAAESPSLMAACKDPQDLKAFCSNFQTYKPFQAQSAFQKEHAGMGPDSTPLDNSAKLCNVKIETLRSKLCSTAESDSKLGFLSQECPTQTAEVVKKKCAGRKYTSDIEEKYRNFCARYISDQKSGGTTGDANSDANDVQDGAQEKPAGLLGKGKKALGGLFGR